jgi:hypothetical protein
MPDQSTHPFDFSIEVNRDSMVGDKSKMLDSLIEVNDTVEFAKKILLQNRVRDFSASDVITLSSIILDRERYKLEQVRLGGDE